MLAEQCYTSDRLRCACRDRQPAKQVRQHQPLLRSGQDGMDRLVSAPRAAGDESKAFAAAAI